MHTAGVQVFVGRTSELSVASSLLDLIRGGSGHALVVEGEAGIGKSRFLDEFLHQSQDSGFDIYRGTARQLERDVPFGPLLHAIDVHEPSIEGMLDAFEKLATRGPTVIAVEDLHWADVSTIQLLGRSLRLLPLLPLLLVASARPHPRPRELETFVEEVRASGTMLPLSPLPPDEVALLTADLLGEKPGPNLLEELGGAAGNPLFVVQLVSAIRDEGALVPVGDALDIARSEVPPSMRVTILRRLSYLSDSTIETLKVAAVLGTSFELVVLAKLLGRSAATVYADLSDAMRAQLLVERGDELAFRHDLVRDALYDDLPSSVRKALHADAAGALAGMGQPATVVAGHIFRSAIQGDTEAVSVLRDAAGEVVRTAPNEAAELLEHALEIAAKDLPDIDILEMECANALLAAGRLKDAEAKARDVIARGQGRSSGRARAILVRSLSYRGQLDDSLEELVLAAEEPASDHEKAGLWAEVARSLAHAGESERAHDAARKAIEIAERVGNDPALALALAADASTRLVGGREATIELLDRAVAIAGDDLREAWRADVILIAAAMLGDPAERRSETIQLLQRGLRDAEEAGMTWSIPEYHGAIGILHHRQGDFDDARAEMEIARELGRALGTWYGDGYLAARLARLAVARGDVEEARSLIQEGEQLRPVVSYQDENAAQFAYAQCLLAQAENRPDDVLAIIRRSSEEFSSNSWWAGYVVFFVDFAPLMLAAGWRGEVEQMNATLSEVLPAEGASSVALLLRLTALLEDDPDKAVKAVDLAVANDDYPAETAVLLEDAAGVLSRHGRTEEAVDYLRTALQRWESFGAPRFAARVEARLRELGIRRGVRGPRGRPSSGWEALTGTEQKVVDLVGRGLVYREIAERLFVSRRTVETHVVHIFEKLGVSSRKELRDLMAQRPPETSVQ
jgi:DNA-binding NarL/FixJ family response regulator